MAFSRPDKFKPNSIGEYRPIGGRLAGDTDASDGIHIGEFEVLHIAPLDDAAPDSPHAVRIRLNVAALEARVAGTPALEPRGGGVVIAAAPVIR